MLTRNQRSHFVSYSFVLQCLDTISCFYATKKYLCRIKFKKFCFILHWSFVMKWFFQLSCYISKNWTLQKIILKCSIFYIVKNESSNITKMLKRFVKNELRWNHQSVKQGNRLTAADNSKFFFYLLKLIFFKMHFIWYEIFLCLVRIENT